MNKLIEYRSLTKLINEVAGRFPRLNDVYTLSKSDALDWCIEILRKMGYGAFKPKPIDLKVENNLVRLPKEVMLLNAVWRNPSCNQLIFPQWWTYGNLFPIHYNGDKNQIITNGCSNFNNVPNCQYRFSVNYPFLIFNFTEQCVVLDALCLELDSDGIPMYPDIPEVKVCLENYILYQWMREPAKLGEYDYNKLLGDKAEYEQSFANARAVTLMPTELEARNQIQRTNNRYHRYRMRKY